MLPRSLNVGGDATYKIYECPVMGWLATFLGNQNMPAKGCKALPQEAPLKERDNAGSMPNKFTVCLVHVTFFQLLK